MTALLTDNLPLLAGTPNGIKKLRELILELAVRGKLVPQDPSDEPASELLKRVDEDTTRSVAGGRRRKQSTLPSIDESEKAFELPNGWEWVRLQQIISVSSGDGLVSANMKPIGGIPVYGGNGINGYHDEKNVSKETLVIGRVGYYCGSIHLTPASAWVTDNALIVSFSEDNFYKNFLFWLLKGTNLKEQENATAQPVISGRKIYPIVLAIPPFAEQHRIVAKVDELMALCDRMEAQQADAESAHAQLVQALLDSLTQARDAYEFSDNWQRLAEHFHTLFTTEPSIDALKQALLQLAVMGKLVPQDANDEPAEKLYERIQAERHRLVTEGVLKKQKTMAKIVTEDIEFTLPSTWKWVPLLEITTGMDSGWSPACLGNSSPSDDVWGVLKTTAVQIMSYLEHENKELPSHLEPRPEAEAKSGDILFTRAGPMNRVGISCLIESTRPKLMISDKIIRFHPVELGAYGRFIALCLNVGETAKYLEQAKSGMAASQVNISQEKLRMAPIPLAPLSEQYRIVVKVDQLMTLCDQLKTRLTQARQLNEQLASTLVERALTEDGQQAPIATDRQVARTLLAAEITHQLHSQRTFGQRKLQKVIYLAEHAAKIAAIQGAYLRDAAGPHDRQLMNQIEGELQNRQWYERIERETVGHAYRPLSQAGQHRQLYSSAWSVSERTTIEQVIELMRDWDTDRCEMTVTLYAAWNDFILEGRPISDEAIVDEVMHSWNDTKLRFGTSEWLVVLAEMKKQKILMPTGFGKRTKGGMLSLPGFE